MNWRRLATWIGITLSLVLVAVLLALLAYYFPPPASALPFPCDGIRFDCGDKGDEEGGGTIGLHKHYLR